MEWEDGKTDSKKIVTNLILKKVSQLKKTFETVIETDFPKEKVDCVGIPFHKKLHELETADR
jgi:hypothetical protein